MKELSKERIITENSYYKLTINESTNGYELHNKQTGVREFEGRFLPEVLRMAKILEFAILEVNREEEELASAELEKLDPSSLN